MLFKTKAIAFNYIKYRDTSIISRIYTREFGLQSYIVNRVRTNNAKVKIAHYQPFTLLELVCYHNEKKDIQRISEVKIDEVLHEIPYQITKSSIALFLTEIMVRIFREEHDDYAQFDFIRDSIRKLDQLQTGLSHFHHQFLLKLGKFIGIVPDDARELLEEVSYFHNKGNEKTIDQIQWLMDEKFGVIKPLSKTEREECLEIILALYKHHFDHLREIKTLPVLKEVMN